MSDEQQPQTGRPPWLPDKFKTEEDLVRSYHAAEKKISELTRNSSGNAPAVRDSVSAQASASIKDTQEAPAVADGHGEADQTTPDDGLELPELEVDPTKAPTVDPEKDRSEVAEAVRRATEGNLDQATIDRLERAGIGKEVLSELQSRMVEGQRAMAQLQVIEMTKTIGGVDVFNEVREWASHELSPDEIAAVDAQLSSPNPTLVRRAVETLHMQWKKAQGPTLISGRAPSDLGPYYESREDQLKDMRDPRYKSDPAFRRSVEQKSLGSRF